PGLTVVPSPGEFDLTIVSSGEPWKVATSGELTAWLLAASRPEFTTGFGAPGGTVTVKVSGGVTMVLFDVAAANVTGALLPVPLASLAKVRVPGFAPAATVQVHL